MPIKKLSKEVASKIAAGEVVERPVSVIKELIENAIDAEATEITINIEEAGRKKIEVFDNGIGISMEDAGKAVERYATSKISSADDLNKIKTLGFRGEALASISAVSRFTLVSRMDGSPSGFNCYIEGGEIKEITESGRQIGTTISVENLFFNVPARLKFLKKDVTERRLINQLVSRYALSYASIRFTLYQDGKKIISTSGNGKRKEVLSSVFDIEIVRKLLPVSYSDEYIKIEGFTSPYDLTRASRRDIYYFINGRLISDVSITSAITKGYYGMLMVGRYPISILFIDISPEEIDVNVHPTKAEIRMKNPSRVFSAIQRTIKKTISAYSPFPVISSPTWNVAHEAHHNENEISFLNFPEKAENITSTQNEGVKNQELTSFGNIPLLRLIGQLGATYIAAEGPDGLYLIDQHAAHERILFEQLDQQSMQLQSQLLLEPVVITIPNIDGEYASEILKVIRAIGFQIEEFGPQSYKIIAVPQILAKYDPKESFMSAFNQEENGDSGIVKVAEREAMITRICKRLAIKAGQILSIVEQEKLIRDLEKCSNPRTCPHGRPTMVHFSVDSLDRKFGRKGSV